MQRRTLLKLGIGSAIVLAAAGGAVALLQPGLVKGKLSDPARLVLKRVAQAILAGSLPTDPAARAHCRAVCGEMHSGFANQRSALPMNLKVRHETFKVWGGAQADNPKPWSPCAVT